jgi:stress response protein YsnF
MPVFRRNPVSIAEVNKFFLENQNEVSIYNQVERDFRLYAEQFSVLKKKLDSVAVIKKYSECLRLKAPQGVVASLPTGNR